MYNVRLNEVLPLLHALVGANSLVCITVQFYVLPSAQELAEWTSVGLPSVRRLVLNNYWNDWFKVRLLAVIYRRRRHANADTPDRTIPSPPFSSSYARSPAFAS